VEPQVQRIGRTFGGAPGSPGIYPRGRNLVNGYGITGVQIFDTRLVAVMLAYSIENILTFNGPDFTPYAGEGITIVDPATVPVYVPSEPDSETK